MAVKKIITEKDFEEAIKSPDLSVIHFAADWSCQCQDMAKVLEVQAETYKTVSFFELQAEDLASLSLKYKVTAVPTFIMFRSGEVVGQVNGADAGKLTTKISDLINTRNNPMVGDTSNQNKQAVVPKTMTLEERLAALINEHPRMIFMKGDRVQPRCGFSRQLIEILVETGLDFKTFDILRDEEVRAGLKTYSNWPTYPQVYVSGELVGGLDIIKELKESGELLSTLQGAS